MSTISGQNGHLAPRCCHPSTAVHTTETALLAALISEHKLLTSVLDYPTSGGEGIIDLLQAHSGATRAFVAWRAAVAIS